MAFALAVASAWGQIARDYVLELAPETPDTAKARHQLVAERRKGPVVMVHRGASAFAPENTLQAYASAMDFGADGVEVDVRRTRDGVLVLFHDHTLERCFHALGSVRQHTARELLALKPRTAFGRPAGAAPASFVQLLDLARQRAMLLHLDLKEADLADDVARWLDAADCWDHIVSINTSNAGRLISEARFRPLRYKVPGLYDGRQDMDPEAVTAALRQPGEMILVDDPRVATMVLHRPPYQPVPYNQSYLITPRPPGPHPPSTTNEFDPTELVAALGLRVNPNSPAELLALINRSFAATSATETTIDPEHERLMRIVERAWAADRLGQLGKRKRDVVRALERVVRARTPDADWRYHRLDGGVAARALGELDATAAVPTLVEAIRHPRFSALQDGPPVPAGIPPAWTDTKFATAVMTTLGDLRCRAAKRFLREYVAFDDAQANALGPPLFVEATRALLRQNLDWGGIAGLLRSPNPAVRGAAVIECLDFPTEERQRALREAAPWASNLPGAKTLPSPTPAAPPRSRPGAAQARALITGAGGAHFPPCARSSSTPSPPPRPAKASSSRAGSAPAATRKAFRSWKSTTVPAWRVCRSS